MHFCDGLWTEVIHAGGQRVVRERAKVLKPADPACVAGLEALFLEMV